jgi:hypothetical protein
MRGTEEQLRTLSLLTINPLGGVALGRFRTLNQQGRSELLNLADAHHVTLRALTELHREAARVQELEIAEWAETAIKAEQNKIDIALARLSEICDALERAGIRITVIKSLDHWPDLGRDLDLFTTADINRLCAVLVDHFNAKVESRSLGDRFAGKWNFEVPGCNKVLELHSGRLGQMGEHTSLAKRFTLRRVPIDISGHRFYVPAPEEQVIAATLQRMYRHLFFRLCDVVNTAKMLANPGFSWPVLQSTATKAGIWPGVASFLKIVSDYIAHYRGRPLELPPAVLESAQYGADQLFVRGQYLRVPVVPCGLNLYVGQLKSTITAGEVLSAARLGCLPVLASVAGVSYRLTGSNQGIW